MKTCTCGNPVTSTRGKICVTCRNRALAEKRRVTFDTAYIAARVDTTDPDGCWVWTRSLDAAGYGRVTKSSGEGLAHRLSYRVHTGRDIKHELDHLCRNPSCVNPTHLEDVPGRVNMHRTPHISAQMQRTHCPSGHPYSGDNLRVYKGKRVCRQCAADARDRTRARQRRARHDGTA